MSTTVVGRITLESLHGLYAGRPIAVLGNGPSLLRHQPPSTPLIGVNRATTWLGIPVDWWLTCDLEFVDRAMVGPGTKRAVINIYAKGGEDLVFGMLKGHTLLEPGMDSLEVAREGKLFVGQSSIKPAIHLALIMGASAVHVYGVDGGGPRIDGTTGDERVQEGYRSTLQWLEATMGLWGGRIVRHV